MRNWLLVIFGMIFSGLILATIIYNQKLPTKDGAAAQTQAQTTPQPNLSVTTSASSVPQPSSSTGPSGSPEPSISGNPSGNPSGTPSGTPPSPASMASNPNPDLSVEKDGLSKATVIINSSEGVIKFKFYSNDAPKTTHRIVELINKGFYNGLIFHRVVPGFVIQGGDPYGNGTGGSGQKLDAEFNNHRHVEGAVAMARAADPNSADSQFYISLATLPHLDHNYTVFGQVVEGMDVVKKIKIGDKMISVIVQ